MTTNNDALKDESEALNSIYGDDTLILSNSNVENNTAAILKLPDLPFSFLFTFSSSYPDTPPQVNGTQSTGSSGKGEGEAAVSILRDVLGRVWNPGQVCLFDLIEEATPLLQQHDHGQTEDQPPHPTSRSASPSLTTNYSSADLIEDPASSIPPPAWALSEPLTVNKSTFVARACAINSLEQATNSISHLVSTNKKVAAATHNITAWRIQNASPQTGHTTTIQDCDDDGETAAGGRLLHLMQLMDVWNVVVVVTRWYGGVKLGSDRFRLINTVARDALVKGGFGKEESEKSKGKGKKK